jgi:RNA polymerase sigma factor (sigma-70 family)
VEHDISQLTGRIAAGDPEAFTAFYHSWFEFMERVAGSAAGPRGRDESFRLDIVHDAMLRVIRFMPTLHATRDLERWLAVVVKSCACDMLRREQRRVRRERSHAHVSRNSPSGIDAAQIDEQLDLLRRELASLDAPRLAMLRMRHQLGWTLERIGEAMGISASAVDGRLSRLLAELRAGHGGSGECRRLSDSRGEA